jgi:drug/metabolite transporter (DMT)-like permease
MESHRNLSAGRVFSLASCLSWQFICFAALTFQFLKTGAYGCEEFFVTGAISNILIALETESLANTFAAFFVGPIVAYFISAIFLKEDISKSRTALLFFGFVGMLLVIKPGVSFTMGTAHALLSGVFYGCFLVSTKWLAGVANSRSLLVSHIVDLNSICANRAFGHRAHLPLFGKIQTSSLTGVNDHSVFAF